MARPTLPQTDEVFELCFTALVEDGLDGTAVLTERASGERLADGPITRAQAVEGVWQLLLRAGRRPRRIISDARQLVRAVESALAKEKVRISRGDLVHAPEVVDLSWLPSGPHEAAWRALALGLAMLPPGLEAHLRLRSGAYKGGWASISTGSGGRVSCRVQMHVDDMDTAGHHCMGLDLVELAGAPPDDRAFVEENGFLIAGRCYPRLRYLHARAPVSVHHALPLLVGVTAALEVAQAMVRNPAGTSFLGAVATDLGPADVIGWVEPYHAVASGLIEVVPDDDDPEACWLLVPADDPERVRRMLAGQTLELRRSLGEGLEIWLRPPPDAAPGAACVLIGPEAVPAELDLRSRSFAYVDVFRAGEDEDEDEDIVEVALVDATASA